MKTPLLSGLYSWDHRHQEGVSSLLEGLAEGLDLRIKQIEFSPGIIYVDYEGEDSRAYKGLLKERFGEAYLERGNVREMDEVRGVIVGHSKHGLLVDLGVRKPKMEYAVISRKILNAQLADGVNLTVKELVEKFCLIPFLALEVSILRVEPRIVVDLSSRQVEYYWNWDKMGFPRIIISGSLRVELEEALENLNLKGKIVELESSTLIAHILTLRLCEDGMEMVKALRAYLKTAEISAYTPNLNRFYSADKSVITTEKYGLEKFY